MEQRYFAQSENPFNHQRVVLVYPALLEVVGESEVRTFISQIIGDPAHHVEWHTITGVMRVDQGIQKGPLLEALVFKLRDALEAALAAPAMIKE